MNHDDLIAKITSDISTDPSVRLAGGTELLMSGLVDSMGMMTLVGWIESELGTRIDPGEIVIENFESVDAIMSLVESLASASRP